MSTALWTVLPYLAIATLAGGLLWRYRYDRFGWTTRSSQIYESRLLRIGSPLFHFGIFGVMGGHIVGLLVPKSWTDRAHVSEHLYHLVAVTGGAVTGLMTVVGLAILIYRRRATGAVFAATTRMDKAMYLLLGAVIATGAFNTVATGMLGLGPEGFDYRETVSVWARQVLSLHPDAALMEAAPAGFQLHVALATALFALWPFTRLVHVMSAPVTYPTRPYVVYRSRAERVQRGLGNRSARRGWERPPM